MIQGIVIAAYLGWIAFGAVSILLPVATSTSQDALPFHLAATSVLAVFWAVFMKQRSPWTFYIYILFPCYFWDQIFVRAGALLLSYVERRSAKSVVSPIMRGILVFVALQSMVVRSNANYQLLRKLTTPSSPAIPTDRFGVRGSP